jgi:ATP/maltotriose-dependent transcriptional regulator MalT
MLLLQGRPAEAVHEAESVLDEPCLAEELLGAAELTRLLGLLTQDDLRRARGSAMSVLGRSAACTDANLSGALCALAFVAWEEGRPADAVRLLHSAVAAADRCPPQNLLLYPRLALAPILMAMGEYAEADELIAEGTRQVETDGALMWTGLPSVVRSRFQLANGRLEDAVNSARLALTARRDGCSDFFLALAANTEAEVALLRGDLDAAARHVERARSLPSPWAGFGATTVTWTAARLADAEGDPERAVQILASVYADPSAHQRLFLDEPASVAWLVRTAIGVDARHLAMCVTHCVEELAAANPGIRSLGTAALHASALLDDDPESVVRAAALYRHLWSQASALEDAGTSYIQRGALGPEAEAHLTKALEVYGEAGAERDAARVRARLRVIGIRSCHWHRSERPVAGWESLTETERAVVEQVAEGLTNRQAGARMFLSHHTIAFHLRQVFRKLDISSRGELIRLTMERKQIA